MNLRPFPKPAPFIDCALAAAAVQDRLRKGLNHSPAIPQKKPRRLDGGALMPDGQITKRKHPPC